MKIAIVGGIGPITATAMVAAAGDAKEFRNRRHLSSWLGLVPRPYSSGDRSQLNSISKRGQEGPFSRRNQVLAF
jgi:transposase